MLPLAITLVGIGLAGGLALPVYLGRLALGIGAVGLLDRFFADPGKHRQFMEQERKAKEAKERVEAVARGRWLEQVAAVKERMRTTRLQVARQVDGVELRAPWGFRNSGMGGRHTEEQYPESNISLQEAMFVPLSARTYEETQEMTVALQTRLQQIINSTEGCRVMGVGLEGGLAIYITPEPGDPVPELRLWRMMKQAIKDLGYVPGEDVALALDPAASELENAFREEFSQPDTIGQYLFWRDKATVVMTRDELLGLYRKALEDDIPIVSIEDGFSERDWAGWKLLMNEFGDKLFIIGDDLVTTNDAVIERAAKSGAINAVLIKANQIGTLTETMLAMLTAFGLGMDLVVSHRSKSPNELMEAHIALAASAMGLKAGGGMNTERLVKYKAVMDAMSKAARRRPVVDKVQPVDLAGAVIMDVIASEMPTNAGVPTVGTEVLVRIPGRPEVLSFTGATPVGTSAGTGEAIFLVDSVIEKGPSTEKYPDLFTYEAVGQTYRFKKGIKYPDIEAKHDQALLELWEQSQRYNGKGVKNAVRYVEEIVAPALIGKTAAELGTPMDIDRLLLELELETAQQRGKLTTDLIAIAQRKGNLGMNGILSLSLALARFKAASEGKELLELELLREQMATTMAKVIAEQERLDWRMLYQQRSFDELVAGLQAVAKAAAATSKPLHQIIRKHLPVYDFDAATPLTSTAVMGRKPLTRLGM
jgi:enolase